MTTYLILNFSFILGIILIARRFGPLPFSHSMLTTILIIVSFTAIFDPIMVGVGLFYYSPDKILGITIGEAPIEDLLYAVLAGILVPTVWMITGRTPKGRMNERKS